MPVLKKIDERVFVVEVKEFWIERIQFVSNQMVEGHARMLRGPLNEPVQCEPFLYLKLLVVHALLMLSAEVLDASRANRG